MDETNRQVVQCISVSSQTLRLEGYIVKGANGDMGGNS